MRPVRSLLIIAVMMALGTWLIGWWAVPIVAAAATLMDRSARAGAIKVSVAAVVAWGALLLVQALFGSSVSALGRDLALSLGVPAIVPIALTLVLPAILAASAAGVVAGVRQWRSLPGR